MSQDQSALPRAMPKRSASRLVAELISTPQKFYEQLTSDVQMGGELITHPQRISGNVVMNLAKQPSGNQQIHPSRSQPQRVEQYVADPHGTSPSKLEGNGKKRGGSGKGRRAFSIGTSGTQQENDIVQEKVGKAVRENAHSDKRVTLKMDVSFLDHSFIIGRQGKGSQGVMRATGCHVHFPDSNKNIRCEKSNQVLIMGQPSGVVMARQKIRERLPVSLAFVLTNDDYKRATMDPRSGASSTSDPNPIIKQVIEALQNEFSMTITWLPMENFNCAVVTVRGRRSNFKRIREGFRRLTGFLRPGQPAPYIYLGIEVSPHHLSFVLGAGNAKVRALMAATQTKFKLASFQSDRSHQMPTVRIFGHIDNVYLAWVAFMDLLPVVLLIDILDTSSNWRGSDDEERCGEELNSGESSQNRSASCLKNSRNYHQDRKPIMFQELVALRQFGVVSSEALAAAVALTEPDGSVGMLHPGFRSILKLAINLNVMLHDYEITLTLRPAQDSRHWNMAIKGPEGYISLLMDIHHVLTNPVSDPLKFVSQALISVHRPRPIVPISTQLVDSGSSSGDLAVNAVQEQELPDEIQEKSTLVASACPEVHRHVSHFQSSCIPCQMLSIEETCQMYVNLLNINRELRINDEPFGNYTISSEAAFSPPMSN